MNILFNLKKLFKPIILPALFLAVMSFASYGETDQIGRETSNPINMQDENLKQIATKIHGVVTSSGGLYEVSDALSIIFYLCHGLTDLGVFELEHEHLITLIDFFVENVREGIPFDDDIMNIVNQIAKIKFVKQNQQSYLVITAKKIEEGIRYSINYRIKNSLSSVMIKEIIIKNNTKVYFQNLETSREKKELFDFYKKQSRLQGFNPLSIKLVNKEIKAHLSGHLSTMTVLSPLKVVFSGISVLVNLEALAKDTEVNIDHAYVVPGINNNGYTLPAIGMQVSKGLLFNLKFSLEN